MLSSLGGDVLPPDWEATTDPSSGNTYYYNTKTNAVSWERPRPAVPPPPGGAPSGGPPPDDLLGFDVSAAASNEPASFYFSCMHFIRTAPLIKERPGRPVPP